MSKCAAIFAQFGNPLFATAQGFTTAHEPTHSSKRGQCVAIKASPDTWVCRSCNERGAHRSTDEFERL